MTTKTNWKEDWEVQKVSPSGFEMEALLSCTGSPDAGIESPLLSTTARFSSASPAKTALKLQVALHPGTTAQMQPQRKQQADVTSIICCLLS